MHMHTHVNVKTHTRTHTIQSCCNLGLRDGTEGTERRRKGGRGGGGREIGRVPSLCFFPILPFVLIICLL